MTDIPNFILAVLGSFIGTSLSFYVVARPAYNYLIHRIATVQVTADRAYALALQFATFAPNTEARHD